MITIIRYLLLIIFNAVFENGVQSHTVEVNILFNGG